MPSVGIIPPLGLYVSSIIAYGRDTCQADIDLNQYWAKDYGNIRFDHIEYYFQIYQGGVVEIFYRCQGRDMLL